MANVNAPAVNCTVSFWRYNMVNNNTTSDAGYGFLFNPSLLTMIQNSTGTTSFTVNFTVDTTSVLANLSGVSLVSCTFTGTNGQPPDFQSSLTNGVLQTTFDNSTLKPGDSPVTYNFGVTVSYGGTNYTSSDPEIVLPPPNG